MGKTFRRDRDGKIYRESLKKHSARYRCRCERCTNRGRDMIIESEKDREIINYKNKRDG